MVKLIYKHHSTDDATYSFETVVPFEYSSKDDFILYILELAENYRKENIHRMAILGADVSLEDAENIEKNVYTLEEWFENEKFILQ